MGEKMTTTLASACVKATVGTSKAVNKIRTKKSLRMIFSMAVAMVTVCVFAIVAFAAPAAGSGTGDGEKVANEMIKTIKAWVGIISGVVIVFGAVNAGLGVANQDDAGRNRGFMTIAGGAIMAAVVAVVGGE